MDNNVYIRANNDTNDAVSPLNHIPENVDLRHEEPAVISRYPPMINLEILEVVTNTFL